jgi:lipopolysaccharide biosynthesis glycosyltransferase
MLIPALFVAASVRSIEAVNPCDLIIFAPASDVDDIHRGWMEENGIKLCDDLDMTPVHGVARIQERLSEATLVKLIIAGHHAGRYDKILYLDADLTIHDDVSAIFSLDTGDFPFAAVSSGRRWAYQRQSEWEKAVAHFTSLGMTPPYLYFNTGVLYIDVEKWNAADVAGRTLSFIGKNAEICYLPDEHGLNGLMNGRFSQLSPIWNVTRRWRAQGAGDIVKPVIIHHTGHDKPWRRFGYRKRLFPDRAAYRAYQSFLARTPWPNWLAEQWGARDLWMSCTWELHRLSRMLRGKSDEWTREQRAAYYEVLRRFCDTEPFSDVEQGITIRDNGRLRIDDRPSAQA